MGRGPLRKYPIGPILRALGAEVGDYRSGKQKIRCPFHDDKRPSAQVDFTANRFTCWTGCATGDALDILVTIEGISIVDAIERAEAITGGTAVEVPVRGSEPAPVLFGRPRAGRTGR